MFWAAFALALVSPGPNFALMLRVALTGGRRAAMRTVLGIAAGEVVWGGAAVLGVAALALRYPMAGAAIRWAGGAFLLWLAFGALRSAWRGRSPDDAAPAASERGGGGFMTGLALMLLNPKAGIFWLSLTGAILGPAASPLTAGAAVGVAVALSLAWHTALALAFSGAWLRGVYARARRGIEAVLGTTLAALGVRLLATG